MVGVVVVVSFFFPGYTPVTRETSILPRCHTHTPPVLDLVSKGSGTVWKVTGTGPGLTRRGFPGREGRSVCVRTPTSTGLFRVREETGHPWSRVKQDDSGVGRQRTGRTGRLRCRSVEDWWRKSWCHRGSGVSTRSR